MQRVTTIASARPRTVLGIWAHPDDEAYLSTGLMARTVRSGGRVVCVHATVGERGTDDPEQWPPHRLGPRRARELRAALGHVGVEQSIVLGHADGGCADVDPTGPLARLREILRAVDPDLVVTFGPDGVTGHADHIAVSRWATSAWAAEPRGTLLYAASSRSFLDRFADLHRELGLLPEDAASVDDRHIAQRVDLDPDELDLKRRVLAAHDSQTAGLAGFMGEDTYRQWIATETFRLPTPAELTEATIVARAS